MLNLLQGKTYEMHKTNKIMALQYFNVGTVDCFSTTYITLYITFDFRHAVLRTDKDSAELDWLTDIIPDFFLPQTCRVTKSYNGDRE